MVTSKKASNKPVLTNSILKGFVENLVSTDDHKLVNYDTTTQELAWSVIALLGGESQFLATYRKICDNGLRKTRCLFTSDDAVRLYYKHHSDMVRSFTAVLSKKDDNYLTERVWMRIGHFKEGQLEAAFYETQVFEDVVSPDRRAISELMADLCIEDFCENFRNHHDDIFALSSGSYC